MIIGDIKVTATSLITHRDTFSLNKLTVVSVRRPLLSIAFVLSLALGGFVWAFHELMYTHEMVTVLVFCALALLIAANLAQLSVLSLDLKGTELSSAAWGHPKALNAARHEIVAARDALLTQPSTSETHHDAR